MAEKYPCCGALVGMWHMETCPVRLAEMKKAAEILQGKDGVAIVNAGEGYSAPPVLTKRSA